MNPVQGVLAVRPAAEHDVSAIVRLLQDCVAAMRAAGIEQWDEIYPTESVIRADIAAGTMYAGVHGGEIAGVVVLNDYQDPEYADVPWTIDDERIAVVHRLMVDPGHQQRGVARSLMAFIEQRAGELGYGALRLDAFTQNPRALRLYQGLGYHDAGRITLRKGVFRVFEKRLRRSE